MKKKMSNEEKTVLEFGSEALNNELVYEGNDYVKFEIGVPVNISVLKDKGAVKSIKDFGDGVPVIRFDISILVNDEEKVWSVSRRVLDTINNYIEETTKFKIVRKEKNYEVIPLGLKA